MIKVDSKFEIIRSFDFFSKEPVVNRLNRQGSNNPIPANVKEKYLELNLTEGFIITASNIEYAQNEKQWSSRLSEISSVSNKRQDKDDNENDDSTVASRIRKRIKAMEQISKEQDGALLDHESRIICLEKSNKIHETEMHLFDQESTYHHERITEHSSKIVGHGQKLREHDEQFDQINECLKELHTAIISNSSNNSKDNKGGFQCELCKKFYSRKSYLPRHKCRVAN